jgi:hypothetical protein
MFKSKFITPLVIIGALALGFSARPAQAQVNLGSGIVINDIDLTDLQIEDGVLTAAGTVSGTLAGLPFTTDIANFALQLVDDNPQTPAEECSVLNLELAPIHVALLGLHADTGPICLDITATDGGGLLGDLLCSLAGGDLLGGAVIPTVGQLTDLVGGLVEILNGTLGGTLNPAQANQVDESVCTGTCDVLELVLGPVDLSLLGLNVSLDDCDNGPVQVCVSATATEGLLGGLLCGLSDGGLLGGIGLGVLDDLLGAILDALPVGGVNATNNQIRQLVNEAGRFLRNGDLSGRELDKLTKTVQKIVRKAS